MIKVNITILIWFCAKLLICFQQQQQFTDLSVEYFVVSAFGGDCEERGRRGWPRGRTNSASWARSCSSGALTCSWQCNLMLTSFVVFADSEVDLFPLLPNNYFCIEEKVELVRILHPKFDFCWIQVTFFLHFRGKWLPCFLINVSWIIIIHVNYHE